MILLLVGVWPGLTDKHLDYMVETLKKAVGRRRKHESSDSGRWIWHSFKRGNTS